MSVYGALCHGRYVSHWDGSTKEMITCYDCQQCCGEEEGVCLVCVYVLVCVCVCAPVCAFGVCHTSFAPSTY